jgi:hypothetical protein
LIKKPLLTQKRSKKGFRKVFPALRRACARVTECGVTELSELPVLPVATTNEQHPQRLFSGPRSTPPAGPASPVPAVQDTLPPPCASTSLGYAGAQGAGSRGTIQGAILRQHDRGDQPPATPHWFSFPNPAPFGFGCPPFSVGGPWQAGHPAPWFPPPHPGSWHPPASGAAQGSRLYHPASAVPATTAAVASSTCQDATAATLMNFGWPTPALAGSGTSGQPWQWAPPTPPLFHSGLPVGTPHNSAFALHASMGQAGALSGPPRQWAPLTLARMADGPGDASPGPYVGGSDLLRGTDSWVAWTGQAMPSCAPVSQAVTSRARSGTTRAQSEQAEERADCGDAQLTRIQLQVAAMMVLRCWPQRAVAFAWVQRLTPPPPPTPTHR